MLPIALNEGVITSTLGNLIGERERERVSIIITPIRLLTILLALLQTKPQTIKLQNISLNN